MTASRDDQLGLYGAFGYDLVFQFENIDREVERDLTQRDMVLYLPDRLFVAAARRAHRPVDLATSSRSTVSPPTDSRARAARSLTYQPIPSRSPATTSLAASPRRSRKAKESFRAGDLFEVVCGQTFFTPCTYAPSVVFDRLRERNPAPYGVLVNLGEAEYLVSASPEMYVRVTGSRVETCPISGTIARGRDVFEDEANIRELLNSAKDESELTMCTDVDRNDKSRICVPGSVKVIGRRQIELYSRLIHTVDHVEGTLREGFDAVDAFLSHMWAVTVTGAPKLWAMRFIESRERSPRRWYGGAFGRLGFDGDADTGLTLRTVRVADGVAETRAGGTLLIDSDPDDEEAETEIKAAAFLDALTKPVAESAAAASTVTPVEGRAPAAAGRPRGLVRPHAGQLLPAGRRRGADRTGPAQARRARGGHRGVPPADARALARPRTPVRLRGRHLDRGRARERPRGVRRLPRPAGHGRALRRHRWACSTTRCTARRRRSRQSTGRARCSFMGCRGSSGPGATTRSSPSRLPDDLAVTAVTDNGVVMAVEHRSLPVAAVQFHPESIMTADGETGLRLVRNVVESLVARAAAAR